MAHVLTDEAFALVDRPLPADRPGRRCAATGGPRSSARSSRGTSPRSLGVIVGGSIPDPTRFGLDVIFPAAMAGLAVGLVTGRRELVAAIVGAVVAVGGRRSRGIPAAGIIAGGAARAAASGWSTPAGARRQAARGRDRRRADDGRPVGIGDPRHEHHARPARAPHGRSSRTRGGRVPLLAPGHPPPAGARPATTSGSSGRRCSPRSPRSTRSWPSTPSAIPRSTSGSSGSRSGCASSSSRPAGPAGRPRRARRCSPPSSARSRRLAIRSTGLRARVRSSAGGRERRRPRSRRAATGR